MDDFDGVGAQADAQVQLKRNFETVANVGEKESGGEEDVEDLAALVVLRYHLLQIELVGKYYIVPRQVLLKVGAFVLLPALEEASTDSLSFTNDHSGVIRVHLGVVHEPLHSYCSRELINPVHFFQVLDLLAGSFNVV